MGSHRQVIVGKRDQSRTTGGLLQALDRAYVDSALPQQRLLSLRRAGCACANGMRSLAATPSGTDRDPTGASDPGLATFSP